MRTLSFLSLTLAFFAGCGTDPNTGRTEPTGKVGLQRFESAEEFERYFAAQVAGFADVSVRGDVDVLQDGTASPPTGDGDAGASPVAAEDGGVRADYSTTTEQEEGVQEGDIVKNDGTYIYTLSNGTLRIVAANPGDTLREVSSVALDGWGQELYITENEVVALTRPDSFYPLPLLEAGDALIAAEPYYYRPQIKVAIINVADRTQPVLESTSAFEGDLVSSRMIGNTLHLIMVNYPDFFAPFIEVRGGAAVMASTQASDVLPDFEIQIGEAEPIIGEVVQVTDFYRPIDPDGYGMTTVVSLDINDPAGFRSVGVVAYPGNIYASTEALYLTNSDFDFTAGSSESTAISKFAFTEAGPVLVGVGSVPGHVLNQYSMSEHEGFLRVATTVQNFNFLADVVPPPTNNVYVLGEQGEELAVVGKAENLAPGETIYAARFYGAKGYLVTFEQVDPLFTLDLSNPASPRAVGELKVPGFSTFILQIDETHLLTVGQDVNLDQGFVRPDGVQLSIFDVSDFANPRLLSTEKVVGYEGWSEALYNPKALTFLPGENLVALPVQIYDYGFGIAEPGVIDVVDPRPTGDGVAVDATTVDGEPGGTDGSSGDLDSAGAEDAVAPIDSFNGVYVYRITPEFGFERLGRLSTAADNQDLYYYASFTRGVFLGDNVFGVTDLGVVGAPKASIIESAPWRVSFPVPQPIPPDDVIIIDEPLPTDIGGGIGGGDDGVVVSGGSTETSTVKPAAGAE